VRGEYTIAASYIKEIIIGILGAGALILIYQGQKDAGLSIFSSLVGFYAGEQVAKRETS